MLNTRRGRIKYDILFIFSLFYEYSNLECVHIYIIYRVNQGGYVIRILVAASQKYVNTYSTRRVCIFYLSPHSFCSQATDSQTCVCVFY